MTEMVEFFKLSYYSYGGGKKLHQICSATCIYRTVFELKNILASIVVGPPKLGRVLDFHQLYVILTFNFLEEQNNLICF